MPASAGPGAAASAAFSGAGEKPDAPGRGSRVGVGGRLFGGGAEDPAEAHASRGARRGLLVGEREHGFRRAGAGLGPHGCRHGAGGPGLGASGEEPFGGAARAEGAVHLSRGMLSGTLQVSVQERHGKGAQVRNVHAQRTPLLAGIFLAAAPAGAGNIFFLLGVHNRASHNSNQKLILGNSSGVRSPPSLPRPLPSDWSRALCYTLKPPRGDFRGEGE